MAVAAPVAPPAPDFVAETKQAIAARESADAQTSADQAAALAGPTAAADKVREEISTLANEPAKTLPLPENAARHIDPKQMNDTAQVFMTIGALFGLMSRQPMTAALSNMTAAMKGVQEGDAEQYDKATAEFKTNLDATLKKNKELLAEQDHILKNKSLSLTERMDQIRLLNTKYGAEFARHATSFKDQMEVIKAREKAQAELVKVAQHAADKQQQMQMHRETLAARNSGPAASSIPQQTVDFYARQSLSGDNSWQVGLARGKVGQALIAAVKDRIPQLAAESGMSPQDASAMKNRRDSIAGAMKQRQGALSAAQQFVRQFKTQADLVEKYLEPGVAGSIPVFNKWIQMGRKGTGDPDVVAFDTAIRGLAREHQRIVTGVTSNAQLHVSAQNTADELANRAMTADQIRSTLKVMREEADNAVDAGKAEVDFNAEQLKHLGPKQGGSPAGGKAPELPAGWSVKVK